MEAPAPAEGESGAGGADGAARGGAPDGKAGGVAGGAAAGAAPDGEVGGAAGGTAGAASDGAAGGRAGDALDDADGGRAGGTAGDAPGEAAGGGTDGALDNTAGGAFDSAAGVAPGDALGVAPGGAAGSVLDSAADGALGDAAGRVAGTVHGDAAGRAAQPGSDRRSGGGGTAGARTRSRPLGRLLVALQSWRFGGLPAALLAALLAALIALPAALGRGVAAAPGRLAAVIDGQRGALFPWSPVALSLGVGLYFGWPGEPAPAVLWLAAGGALALLPLCWRLRRSATGPPLLGLLLLLAGLALAGLRAQALAAPVLGFRYYGPVEGRIVAIDRSASDKLRLTLDRVVLERVRPEVTPARIRISLHGEQDWIRPAPGMVVVATANLSPPEGPVSPGGYDFRRLAWFRQLGALGYTRTPVLLLEPAPSGGELWLERIRDWLAARIKAGVPGQAGAFAAVITTGDASGLDQHTQQTLRDSNLSHILSISGLHMVLLCGAVFWAVRLGLALIPGLALRYPLRKWAAVAALLVGAFYYLLSGRAIPAERAWVMIAVVFGAVLIERQAVSLRSLAVAALVVLVLRPESLIDPGTQMSFGATLALVAAFTGSARWIARMPRWLRGTLAAALSSLVAGTATAPIAAAHFNRLAEYGLLANMLAVPAMGLAVMPLMLAWVVALPFGLGAPLLWLIRWPSEWILWVGAVVAGLPGAVTPIPAPMPAVLPVLAFGGVALALWQGRGRWLGLAPLALGFALWAATPRPLLQISAEGALLGLMTPEGRALSKPKGQGFAAGSWLQDDGDRATQAEAAARPGIARGKGELRLTVGGLRLLHVSGRDAEARTRAACGSADLLLTTVAVPEPPCPIWDAATFRASGALALWPERGGLRVESVSQHGAGRLWSPGITPPPELPRPGAGGGALSAQELAAARPAGR